MVSFLPCSLTPGAVPPVVQRQIREIHRSAQFLSEKRVNEISQEVTEGRALNVQRLGSDPQLRAAVWTEMVHERQRVLNQIQTTYPELLSSERSVPGLLASRVVCFIDPQFVPLEILDHRPRRMDQFPRNLIMEIAQVLHAFSPPPASNEPEHDAAKELTMGVEEMSLSSHQPSKIDFRQLCINAAEEGVSGVALKLLVYVENHPKKLATVLAAAVANCDEIVIEAVMQSPGFSTCDIAPAIKFAAENHDVKMLEKLLATSNASRLQERTWNEVFGQAIKDGHIEVLQFLQRKGLLDVILESEWTCAPIYAARYGHDFVLEWLYTPDIRSQVPRTSWERALASAAEYKQIHCVRFFNTPAFAGMMSISSLEQALYHAAWNGDLEMLEVLKEFLRWHQISEGALGHAYGASIDQKHAATSRMLETTTLVCNMDHHTFVQVLATVVKHQDKEALSFLQGLGQFSQMNKRDWSLVEKRAASVTDHLMI